MAAALRAACPGRTIEVFAELDSTNAYLLNLPVERDVTRHVVLAEHQSAGRGRMGRSWSCPRGGGILCTVGLHDPDRRIDAPLLALLVPVALCDGIRDAAGVTCEIKWPNDLMVDARKLGGVLIEARTLGTGIRYAIGFGINCLQHAAHFPPELRGRVTSLDLTSDQPVDRVAVAAAVLNALDRRLAGLATTSPDAICRAWKARAIGLGGRVEVVSEGRTFTGNLLDVDPTAAILVQLDEGGRRQFHAAGASLQIL